MSQGINPTVALYKAIQKQIKAYKGAIEFGVVVVEGLVHLYSDRSYAMHFLVNKEGVPFTWREEWESLEDHSMEAWGVYIFETALKHSGRGDKKNLISRKKIIASKQMITLRNQHPDLDDIAIAKYIIYQGVADALCKECQIGEIVVEVGSYAEYHECLNCGSCRTIK